MSGPSINRYVVDAVVVEGRSIREVARAHGVSKSWVAELVKRYRAGGYEALVARSKAPHRIVNRTSTDVEDRIVGLRKHLSDAGFDAGAQTIHAHLTRLGVDPPTPSTIHRILRRRGFVTPEPHKRPRSSWKRFEAHLPNECWQTDLTHWQLTDGTEVMICNFLDDHSRLLLASRAFTTCTANDIVDVFEAATSAYGDPESVLSDNGAVYTAAYRNGRCAMESLLLSRGIVYKHSRPYHPQTLGKVERFHQTLKRFLAKRPLAHTLAELQSQIDLFAGSYNDIRPHRAHDRQTPRHVYSSRDKARPTAARIDIDANTRVRHDVVDKTGVFTLRHRSRLHHVWVGAKHKGTRIIVLVNGLDIRVLTHDGQPIRRLTLDPTRDYQGAGTGRWPRAAQ